MCEIESSELDSRLESGENDFSLKFSGPTSIEAPSLLAAFQLSKILEPPKRFPPLSSSPLVKKPIRRSNFLSCGDPSDKFFPTDEWKMPQGTHIHLKTLISNTIVSPMVKDFKEWKERPDLFGTCLCCGHLETMAGSLFPSLSEKNLCTFKGPMVKKHCDLVVKGAFYTSLHLDLQGITRSNCIVTPGSLKIWIIANSKKDAVTKAIQKYLNGDDVNHQTEIDWLIKHHHDFLWVLQYPGQALEHCGSYYHAVITMVDLERNPNGWCVSTGVQFITPSNLVAEDKHAAPQLQRGSIVLPVSKQVYLNTVAKACRFKSTILKQSINRRKEIAAKLQAARTKKKMVAKAQRINASLQRRAKKV